MHDLVVAGTANGAVARVLMVFLCQQGPFSTLELAQLSGVARGKTLRLALNYLEAVEGLVKSSVSAHGALTWSLKGSIEVSEGRLKFSRQPTELEERLRQFFSQTDGQDGKNSQPARGNAEENNYASRKNSDSGVQNGKNSLPARGKFPRQWPRTSQDGRNSQPGKSLLIKDSKSTDSLKTLVLAAPKKKIINHILLENAALIFGKPVVWHKTFASKKPEEVLGWMAQAWKGQQTGRLARPWGLVYRGLLVSLQEKLPDKAFRTDPWEYLPVDYLRAVGLAGRDEDDAGESEPAGGDRQEPEWEEAESDLTEAGEQQDVWEEAESMSAEGGEQELKTAAQECAGSFSGADRGVSRVESQVQDVGGESRAEGSGMPEQDPEPGLVRGQELPAAWESMKDRLKNVVTIPKLWKFLCEARPLGWDGAGACLQVAVASQEAADWLENRAARTVEHALCGILNRPVAVRFISAEEPPPG